MALDINDKTSNGNNLTNNSATEWTTNFPFAASTEAVAISGTQNLTATTNNSSLNLIDFTIEAWINLTAGAVSRVVVQKDAGSSQDQYLFGLNSSYILQLQIQNSGGPGGIGVIPTTTWTHVAVTWTNSTKAASFYINGSLDTTTTFTTSLTGAGNSSPVRIGNVYNNGQPILGNIDEVRIWNVVRSAAQILSNYNIELTGSESGLVAYWPFESLNIPAYYVLGNAPQPQLSNSIIMY